MLKCGWPKNRLTTRKGGYIRKYLFCGGFCCKNKTMRFSRRSPRWQRSVFRGIEQARALVIGRRETAFRCCTLVLARHRRSPYRVEIQSGIRESSLGNFVSATRLSQPWHRRLSPRSGSVQQVIIATSLSPNPGRALGIPEQALYG